LAALRSSYILANYSAPLSKALDLHGVFMQMSKLVVTLITMISLNAFAGEPLKLGMTGDVEAEGFFSPTLISYTVKKVKPNSRAENAGIVVGQKIISVENCKIPGCPVDKAKKLMRKEAGDILNLLMENEDGSQIPVKITFSAL
jgi:C-terminal processing protease CtpA/Prc